jgi:outer membrane receptor protein involved in Fe transport
VKADWQKWTGKIALDHFLDVDWSDQTLLYASLSSGYKGGGMNVGNDVDPTFDPEEVTSFEMGTKNQFFGNQLRANLTAFYYDYAGLQLAQRIGTSAVTANTDATVWGIEAEFDWAPNENWLFDLNLAYLNTEISDFLTTDSANPRQDPPTARPEQLLEDDPSTEDFEVNLRGNYLPHSPEFSVKFGAQYAWMMGGWDASARVDYFYQDDYFSREFNTVNDALESWDITNLIFRVQNGSGKWAFSAFLKNLQDNDNITNSIIETGLVGAYRNVRVLEPRTYGITAQYMF